MPIEFHCEFCARLLRVPDGSQGKQCQCPGCGKLLKIPQQTTAQTSATTNLPAIAICIPCPKCHHELICDPSLIGTKGQCRSCKHIFLITEDPNAAAQELAATNWVFNCPKCNQLFEGNEGMRGRKGKCHVCGQVFQIEIKLAGSSPAAPATTQAPASPASQPLTQSVAQPTAQPAPKHSVPEQTKPTFAPATPAPQNLSKPTTPLVATTKAEVIKPANASNAALVPMGASANLTPIQFACNQCQGILEVAGDAVDQITFCPFCEEQLTVPSKSTPNSDKSTSSLGNGDIFDSIPRSSNVGLDDLPPMDHMPLGMGHQHSMPRYGKGNAGTKYVVCGVLTIICAVISIAAELYQLIAATLTAMSSAVRAESFAAGFVALFVGLALIVSIIQVIGGIAMIRRKGLGLAQTAAIINCLPCICINFPIGIWGAVITFGASARNDFQ